MATDLPPRRADIARQLPAPSEVDWSFQHVAANSLLALFLLALLGLPLTVINNTIDEHRADFAHWFRAVRAPFRRLKEAVPGDGLSQPTRYVVLAAVSALIYSFLSPSFGLRGESLVQYCGILAGIVGANVVVDVAVATFTYARYRVTSQLVLHPGTALLAFGCVLLSRTTGLRPGLVLGSVGGGKLSRPLTTQEAGVRVAVRQLVVVLVAGYAWLCYGPVSQAAAAGTSSFEVRVLDAALATVALSGVSGMVFSLLPMAYLDGCTLKAWSPRLWFGMWLAAAVVFVQVVVNPTEGEDEWVGREGYLLTLLAVYCAVAAALYGFFRWRVRRGVRASV